MAGPERKAHVSPLKTLGNQAISLMRDCSWAEILENPSSKLKNCITLITFRIERDNPLNLQPLHNVETKRCEPLASPSIKGLLKQYVNRYAMMLSD